ncbi:hypothetical protein BGW42_006082 [Actinomortierella wolfii]|nr:hypothetical protein BGW42_006082 [Actinomortierella wolfii]
MTCSDWALPPLIPPFRFGTVEHEVYRGAYPKQRNLRFLKRLKLRTVLSLIPDAVDDDFLRFCEEQGIRWIHLPVDKVKDNVPLTYSRTVEAIQVIINPDNMPIYIHCLDGACVTGLVIACIRKLQTWNISSALGEFLRYLRGGVISSEESVFVEKFCSEIEISRPIPPWLWEGQIQFKRHPTLKIHFKLPPDQLAATNHPRYSAGCIAGIRGSTYGSSNLSDSNQSQQQQHVAFAAPNVQQVRRQSRHHHSSSSISSVLGFQTVLPDGGTLPSNIGISQSQNTDQSTKASTVTAGGDTKDSLTSDSRGTSVSPIPHQQLHHQRQSSSASSSSSTTNNVNAARDSSFPRLARTKSIVRAELGSQRPTSVPTPTTASMKEARGRRSSLLYGQTTTLTPTSAIADSPMALSPSSSASSMSAATTATTASLVTAGTSGGGIGTAAMARGAAGGIGSAKETRDALTADPSPILGDGAAGSDVSSTRMSPMPTAMNSSSNETTTITTAAASHIRDRGGNGGGAETSNATDADEYYDVSLTLKALSLEGADW